MVLVSDAQRARVSLRISGSVFLLPKLWKEPSHNKSYWLQSNSSAGSSCTYGRNNATPSSVILCWYSKKILGMSKISVSLSCCGQTWLTVFYRLLIATEAFARHLNLHIFLPAPSWSLVQLWSKDQRESTSASRSSTYIGCHSKELQNFPALENQPPLSQGARHTLLINYPNVISKLLNSVFPLPLVEVFPRPSWDNPVLGWLVGKEDSITPYLFAPIATCGNAVF